MLALLLFREMERQAPDRSSATSFLNRLETTQLVHFRLAPDKTSYALTEPDADLQDALRLLQDDHLVDDAWAGAHITPR